MKSKINIILLLIIVLSAFLRIWNLNKIPPGLTPDEAALGYNAYSILKTGRDEYGKFLPVIFKSFGDYKPGFYVYLTAPFVAVFGLNEWSVRLPSALSGVFSVFLLYLILYKLTNKKELGIWSAFLLAISPWHIQFSRGAWEVNVALTLTLLGIYYFLQSLTQIKYLKISVIAFAATLLTYQGAKLSTAIVVLCLCVAFYKEIIEIIKTDKIDVVKSLILGLLISTPIIFSIFTGAAGRLEVFSVFSYPRPRDYLQNFLDEGSEKYGTLSYYLFHSETLNFTRGVMGRWFNHFSGRFLFFEGDWANPRHTPPNHGTLLLFDLLLLPLGVMGLIRTNYKNIGKFILLWLLLAPLPAAMSRDAVQAVRSYNMLVPFVIISAFGIVYLIEFVNTIKHPIFKIPLMFVVIAIFSASFLYYLDSYLVHVPTHNAKYWEYGMKQIVQTVSPIRNNYSQVIIQQSYAQPYIYFLFYEKYDPKKYQDQAKLTNYLGPDVGLVDNLDNIAFSFFSWPIPLKTKTLVVGTPVVITSYNPNDYNLIKDIKYPNGDVIYKVLESKI